jgi:hypothetical protein
MYRFSTDTIISSPPSFDLKLVEFIDAEPMVRRLKYNSVTIS